ncbi:MAG: hypothetical protein J0H14_24050 [Alphaproteobacteria bacterium]|nr:hypothetical protein [Alphaproteobacteria bacterium]
MSNLALAQVLLRHARRRPGIHDLIARRESRGWSAFADHDDSGSETLGQPTELIGTADPVANEQPAEMT